jgi:hypothetical protein
MQRQLFNQPACLLFPVSCASSGTHKSKTWAFSASCKFPFQYKTVGGVDICCNRNGNPDESGQKS